jgi:hypothetical protein
MKTLFTVLVITSLGFSAVAQNTSDSNGKKTEKVAKQPASAVEFKTMTIDRQNIPYGADETFTFEFKNNSKSPLIISNVQTSCGCTTAKKPEAPVAPKKSDAISVKYDTKREGPFTKTITVTTNLGEPIVLTIKGNVTPKPAEN